MSQLCNVQVRIIPTPELVNEVEREHVRTWKERLLELPWRPWVHTVVEYTTEPSDEIVVIDHRTFMVHPDYVDNLVSRLKEVEEKYRVAALEGLDVKGPMQ